MKNATRAGLRLQKRRWDGSFDHVTEDLEVTAQYVPEDEYVTLALDRDAVTLKAGETLRLAYELDVHGDAWAL